MATTVPAPARPAAEVHENRSSASLAAAVGRRIGVSVLTLVISTVVLVAAWYALLALFQVDSFVGKRPQDVYDYLVTVPKAAENRAAIQAALLITLTDSVTGFVTGVVAAVAVAAAFTVFRPLEFVFMPLAMLLRSVPLVAMAPLIGSSSAAGWAVRPPSAVSSCSSPCSSTRPPGCGRPRRRPSTSCA